MIWSVGKDDKPGPIARIYAHDGSVEVVEGYNSATQLTMLTSTDLTLEGVGGLLDQLPEKSGHALLVAAVVGAVSNEDAVQTLMDAVDAVFIVPPEDIATIARRLARAITVPGEPFHHACCDWNDMRAMVARTVAVPGRTGFGRAEGRDAAKEAVTAALSQLGNIQHARVLSLLTGSKDLRGAQVKEVAAEIRRHAHDSNYIGGAVLDDSMPDGALEVDIFVFGPAIPYVSDYRTTNISSNTEVLDIPAFLRKSPHP